MTMDRAALLLTAGFGLVEAVTATCRGVYVGWNAGIAHVTVHTDATDPSLEEALGLAVGGEWASHPAVNQIQTHFASDEAPCAGWGEAIYRRYEPGTEAWPGEFDPTHADAWSTVQWRSCGLRPARVWQDSMTGMAALTASAIQGQVGGTTCRLPARGWQPGARLPCPEETTPPLLSVLCALRGRVTDEMDAVACYANAQEGVVVLVCVHQPPAPTTVLCGAAVRAAVQADFPASPTSVVFADPRHAPRETFRQVHWMLSKAWVSVGGRPPWHVPVAGTPPA